MDTLIGLGELVKRIRYSNRLSQADLARLIGVNKDVISKVEAGRLSEGVALRLIISGLASSAEVAYALELADILDVQNQPSNTLSPNYALRKAFRESHGVAPASTSSALEFEIEHLGQLLSVIPEARREAVSEFIALCIAVLRTDIEMNKEGEESKEDEVRKEGDAQSLKE